MKDILNREIPDDSLVIGMIVSRDSDGMRFGVSQGEHVGWQRYGLVRSKPRNVYLVEHPSEQELKIKQEITDAIHKEELEKEVKDNKRKALKRIPTKQLVPGGYYTDDKGNNWCYLGKATVKSTVTDDYSRVISGPDEEHGYCYVSQWHLPKLYFMEVFKSPKKLVNTWEPEGKQKIDMGNLKETIVGTSWYNGKRYSTTEVTLDA